jgi:hypothetical protein
MTGFEGYTNQAIVEELRKPQRDINSTFTTKLIVEGLARLLERAVQAGIDRRHIDSLMTPGPGDFHPMEPASDDARVSGYDLYTPPTRADQLERVLRKVSGWMHDNLNHAEKVEGASGTIATARLKLKEIDEVLAGAGAAAPGEVPPAWVDDLSLKTARSLSSFVAFRLDMAQPRALAILQTRITEALLEVAQL